eukprot:3175354-Pyramimonas_sp.AAC.1
MLDWIPKVREAMNNLCLVDQDATGKYCYARAVVKFLRESSSLFQEGTAMGDAVSSFGLGEMMPRFFDTFESHELFKKSITLAKDALVKDLGAFKDFLRDFVFANFPADGFMQESQWADAVCRADWGPKSVGLLVPKPKVGE